MLSTMWATKWLRLVVAIFIGAVVYAFLFSSLRGHDPAASWWPTRPAKDLETHDDGQNDQNIVSPEDEVADEEPSSAVDWSQFAYTQYATDSDYLCNSVMLFEVLHRLGSRAERVLMYPSKMMPEVETEPTTDDQRLLRRAAEEYGVHLVPVQVQHRDGHDATWADSFTKLLAFNQTQYRRVLSLDSDSTLLQPMDELFLAPDCAVAMPRAYWLLPKDVLSSQVLLIKPDVREFERVYAAIGSAGGKDYDMEIMNDLYKDSAMILPHRPYDMLTGEFRNMGDHSHYLGNDYEQWDPVVHFNEAKFLHFSDWPVPKPWIKMSDKQRNDKQPSCREDDGVEQCVQREMWNGFYSDFTERRERVCNVKERKKSKQKAQE